MSKKTKKASSKAIKAAGESLRDAIASMYSAAAAYREIGGRTCKCGTKVIEAGKECCRYSSEHKRNTKQTCCPDCVGGWFDSGEPCEPPPSSSPSQGKKASKKKPARKKAKKSAKTKAKGKKSASSKGK